jgi:hypothetical protein
MSDNRTTQIPCHLPPRASPHIYIAGLGLPDRDRKTREGAGRLPRVAEILYLDTGIATHVSGDVVPARHAAV